MKSTVFLFIFFIGNVLFAQQGDNRFSESEQNTNSFEETTQPAPEALDGGPSNPPGDDPVPIDDYLPFLVITALGIIILATHKKKNLLS